MGIEGSQDRPIQVMPCNSQLLMMMPFEIMRQQMELIILQQFEIATGIYSKHTEMLDNSFTTYFEKLQ